MSVTSGFRRYLLPGFVFQSLVIAGGYGTGRELVEFFLTFGPLGGLLGMTLVATAVWSAVCVVSFEFCRVFGAHDYRTFFRGLLGQAWWLYEICYVALVLIVLAVIAAAAGAVLRETLGLPYAAGVLGMMAAVGFLVFKGSSVIEGFLAFWSFLLYGVYIAFCILCFTRFGAEIAGAFQAAEVHPGWAFGGVRYAAYNLGIIPAVFFTLRHAERRRHTVTAGVLAGPIAIIPGLLFYIAMAGQYPEVLDRPVPANFILELLGSNLFQLFFQAVLFGTLIETGTGLIHAVNERIASVYKDRKSEMPRFLRPTVALGFLLAGAGLARFGLIDLVAKGYGTLTYLFLLVFVLPVLTVGVWKVARARVG
jgi:uncharacterized membrane protein YkvI